MSKLEMVKRLDSSQPQLQIVAAVRDLQSETKALRQDLMSLPRLHQQVDEIAQALDRILAIQRQALEEMVEYMTDRATQTIEQKTSRLDQTMQKLAMLPDALTSAQREMKAAAEALVIETEKARGWLWAQVTVVIASAVVIGMATVYFASRSPQLPADVLQKAQWADAVLSRATPKEKELLRQIAARPER